MGRNRDVSSAQGEGGCRGGEGRTHVDEKGVRELELFVGHAEGEHGVPCGDVLGISGHGAEALDSGIDVSICGELLELQGEVVRPEEFSGRRHRCCKGAHETEHTRSASGEHQRTVGDKFTGCS